MTYVLVFLTFVGCVVLHSVIRWAVARKPQVRPTEFPAVLALGNVSAPAGVFLDRAHTWVRVEPSGRTRVGMDDFLRKAFGRIDRIELPMAGQEFRRGQKLFSIRQGERTAPISAPVDGVVTSVNEGLARHAEIVQSEPYGQGWVCTLQPAHLASDLRQLLIAEESTNWLQGEVRRLQKFFAACLTKSLELGQLSPDGGQLTTGALEKVDDETWDLFVGQFLQG